MIAVALDADPQRYSYPHNVLPSVIAALSWAKWLTAGVGIVCIVGIGLLAISRALEARRRRLEPPATVAAVDVPTVEPGGLGVCCSGGGIRAAAYSLGALDQLERAGTMGEAKWLAAVSGGNYAATSWTLAKAADPERLAAADVIAWLRHADSRHAVEAAPVPRQRPRRPRLGGDLHDRVHRGQPVRARRAGRRAVVAGRTARRHEGDPARFHALHGLPREVTIATEHWAPGLVFIVAGLAVLVFSALPVAKTSWMWRVAAALVAVGVALEILTVFIPMAMAFVGSWMRERWRRSSSDRGRRRARSSARSA